MTSSDPELAARAEAVGRELEALLAEPVVAFGSFAAPGYVYSGVRRRAVPGTAWWYGVRSRFGKSADRLPPLVFLAVTRSRIVAVSMETSWRSARAGFPIEVQREWDRSSTTVQITVVADGPQVRLIDDRGETRLDSGDSGQGFNDAVLVVLGT